ncbi:MAG: hypothetical protein HY658_10815 [Actinobacteria bacterium]|nr:hypothetical protein [Actinomycetota bacterium]
MRKGTRVAVVLALGGAVMLSGFGVGAAVFAQEGESPEPVPTEVPGEILERARARLEEGAGPLFGVVHGDLSLLRFDGEELSLGYDRGMIVSRTADTVTVLRLDGVSVTFAVDPETLVREGLEPGTVEGLEVGDVGMFFSEPAEGGGTRHAVLVRCVQHRHLPGEGSASEAA